MVGGLIAALSTTCGSFKPSPVKIHKTFLWASILPWSINFCKPAMVAAAELSAKIPSSLAMRCCAAKISLSVTAIA